jgi:hypothetical protein
LEFGNLCINPNFNSPEFEGIKNEAGLNRFVLSVKQWIEKTNAIGIVAKAGRYGGTYAHKDLAFEFASWVSPQFKLYLLREFQRLKEEEQKQLGWNAKRELSKEIGIGMSEAQLWNCRQFYMTFPEVQILYTLCRDLSWSH